MASPATNRMNARNSTGPRSVEGKAVTRFNAMKHGLDAASLVIPGEDPAEFAQLSADFRREYAPQGAPETELVETIIRSVWFQHRYFRLEAQIYEAIISRMENPETATIGEAFYQDAAGPNVLGKLFRRQQAAQRDFNRALAELRRLQNDRAELEMFQPSPMPCPPPTVQPVDGPRSKPVPAELWVGSEPPSCRL
jgi:hypothetical protein